LSKDTRHPGSGGGGGGRWVRWTREEGVELIDGKAEGGSGIGQVGMADSGQGIQLASS